MSEREPASSSPLRALLAQRPAPGRLLWIGIRERRLAPMRVLSHVELLEGRGLAGDYASARALPPPTEGTALRKRQVSLLQAEHLPVIAALTRRDRVEPAQLRRNLLIEGINVLALRTRVFRIGDVILRGSGSCEPCSKMEANLGTGGYNAMRGHGGILAQVVRGGSVELGDEVDFFELE